MQENFHIDGETSCPPAVICTNQTTHHSTAAGPHGREVDKYTKNMYTKLDRFKRGPSPNFQTSLCINISQMVHANILLHNLY